MDIETHKKLRILCLHGFRGSAEILTKEINIWPEVVLDKLDLVFLNGPYPAEGKSALEGVHDPPYYEWFQASEDFKVYYHFEDCLDYLEDYMLKHGPFDGLLGFSQGAWISAAVPGIHSEGIALRKVPSIRLLIIISGGRFGGSKFGAPKIASSAFSSTIKVPSIHIIGETDITKEQGDELLDSFEDPLVIRHSGGHIVPKLGAKCVKKILDFIEKRLVQD